MNKSIDAFDPEFSKFYSKLGFANKTLDSRQLFYLLNQPINNQNTIPMAYEFVGRSLKQVEQLYSAAMTSEYSVEKLKALPLLNIPPLSESLLRKKNLLKCIKQTTAIQLTQADWLQNTFQIVCGQTSTSLQLLVIYQQLTKQLNSLYKSLLLNEGVKIPILHSEAYSQQSNILSRVFDAATIQLAFKQFPRVYLAEILGFTLAYCQLPTLIEICFPNHSLTAGFFQYRKQLLAKQLSPMVECINDYLQSFPQQPEHWLRVQRGFWLYQRQIQQCRDQFNQHLNQQKPIQKKIILDWKGAAPEINYTKLNNRELYYYLVNADLYPDVVPTIQTKTAKLLKRCALFNQLPFKHYSHQKFNTYIESIYQTERRHYQPLQGKPKISKAAYVWGIEQIAPMILIDGCWLQRCLVLQNSYPEVCDLLFTIYADEIGNGQLKQNHPFIFKQLLDSLNINVPAVDTKEFVKYSRFMDSAFDLPSYMLALSLNPERFLPELLGLNMAIELSGLGNSYQNLVDEWRYWGIDPSIANIHITIDNFDTGHALLAKQAIQLYLDDVMKNTGDMNVLNSHWRRIYTGYTSLGLVGSRFKLGLPIYYLINKVKVAGNK